MPNVLWLVAIPFISSLVIFLAPRLSDRHCKVAAVTLSLLPLLLLLLPGYENWIGQGVRLRWMSPLSIEFYLKVDSLSLLFVALTVVIIPITLLSLRSEALSFPRTFYGFTLILQGLLIAFFTARDLALFTIFWEAMLFPLYFMISIWGGPSRKSAALKFLIYMIAGSSLMVAAVLGLYFASSAQGTGTFDLDALAGIASSVPHATLFFAIFALAFSVKTPLFPFHAWLPDAYCEAPTAGTVFLSALLSKAGIYGFLRIGIGLFPALMQKASPLLLGLAIAGVFMGA